MKKSWKKGQSALEYTLILGAVIAVIVVVLFSAGGLQGRIQNAYQKAGQAVDKTATDADQAGVFK